LLVGASSPFYFLLHIKVIIFAHLKRRAQLNGV